LPEQMFYNTGISTFVWIVTNRKAKERKGKIQLIDVRDRWEPMRKSLGNKRRYLSDEIIDAVTREHGAFKGTKTCKVFDNSDFGYRRITVERPLRLRFQLTATAKEKFLDAVPDFFDALEVMERELGTDPYDDWNEAWDEVQRIAKSEGMKWTAASKKLFRQCFTDVDPTAKPVVASDKKGVIVYEADPALRDFENVPLKEDIHVYFKREVAPFVADAFIDLETVDEQDGKVGKVGYEINFNRLFFKYQPPRPLEKIDSELEAVEKRILELLKEVTE
jgi:type I restriction enzyme M protein